MEKKKRFRPTLGAYRALEDEVSQLKEQVRLLEKASEYSAEELAEMEGYKKKCDGDDFTAHILAQETHGWREKWNALNEECNTLKVSNDHMEKELARLNEKLRERVDKIRDLETDIYVLKNRGFWARVFNRE